MKEKANKWENIFIIMTDREMSAILKLCRGIWEFAVYKINHVYSSQRQIMIGQSIWKDIEKGSRGLW